MARKKLQSEWERDVRDLYDALQDYPESTKLQSAYWQQLTGWYNTLIITVQIPGNEKLPYTPLELGMMTEKMPLKSESNYDQIADYNIRIRGEGIDMVGGLVAERKSLPDLFGTLLHGDSSLRLYREVDRFYKDNRFDTFVILAECTDQQFMNYLPDDHEGSTDLTHSKLGKIASLFTRGTPVWWCGNHTGAALRFKYLTKQWIFKNWQTVMENNK